MARWKWSAEESREGRVRDAQVDPPISKKSCLRPSDVVRCLSTEQRLTELHTPDGEPAPPAAPGPFREGEAERSELQRGGEPAERKAAGRVRAR